MISDVEIEAAARELYFWGSEHGWWTSSAKFEELDPIGREEFEAIVDRVLKAAASARDNQSTL